MSRKLLIAWALLFLILGVSTSAEAGTTGRIEGTVRDAATGTPLARANIEVLGTPRGAATNESGNFFILEVPGGTHTLKVTYVGYRPVLIENVRVIADFSAVIDFGMEASPIPMGEVRIAAARPLVERDLTSSVQILAGEDLALMPIRGYQEAVATQAGVVSYFANPERDISDGGARSTPILNIRGGRANEVAYYVDGFSQQDFLTGLATTWISNTAIDHVVLHTGGLNAEYGRAMSGVVNVITREGTPGYSGSMEVVTDQFAGSWVGSRNYGYNVYDLSMGGPLVPGSETAMFYLSGERRFNRDRQPRALAEEVSSNGRLPNNWLSGWTWQGKLTWHPTARTKLKLGTLGSEDTWSQFLNAYRMNLDHSPRTEDRNRSFYATLIHSRNSETFYNLGVAYFLTERKRGDGVYFDDLARYGRPTGNASYDETGLYMAGDTDSTTDEDEHVWNGFYHRRSHYLGMRGGVTSRVHPLHLVRAGFDFQRHTLRAYYHLFPTQLYLPDPNYRDVDNYGYEYYLPGEIYVDPATGDTLIGGGEMAVDDGLNGAKHPLVVSAYTQDTYETDNLVVNAGLRYDYLDVDTKRLVDESTPLGEDGVLGPEDLTSSKPYHRFSPRLGLGFPTGPHTVLHVNYGRYIQHPNLLDLYVSYPFLEYKLQTGGYFYPFGNPNLRPEETTAYEAGITQQLGDGARLDIVAYYKDVKNLVEVTSVASDPNSFGTYRNLDFGTIKGVDVTFHLTRSGPLQATAAYSLSRSTGTGSASLSQSNIAWLGLDPPRQTAPLSFDRRHKLAVDLDFRLGPGEGPPWGRWRPLENTGLNLLLTAASGRPYTPTAIHNEVSLTSLSQELTGPLNSRYGPWTYRTDLRLDRAVSVGGTSFDCYIWVLNLFNRRNATSVYRSTGSPYTTGWLATSDGENFLEEHEEYDAEDRYRSAERNPNNFDIPRLVRFGMRVDF